MNRTITVMLAVVSLAAGNTSRGGELESLPPFLEVFQSVHQVTIVAKPIQWPCPTGFRKGLLVRPEEEGELPALVVLAGHADRNFSERTARELAGIGYVVLVVELPDFDKQQKETPHDTILREQILSSLTAAVRWLRRCDDVSPDRIGAVAWSAAAPWAVELAADQHLQACVVCDGALSARVTKSLAGQLRNTNILLVNSGNGRSVEEKRPLAQFRQSLVAAGVRHRLLEFGNAGPGFMNPDRRDVFNFEAADRAWFGIYEFLGKHVEDADLKRLLASRSAIASPPLNQVGSIADLMRAVNAPSGVRGQVAKSLVAEPSDDAAWKQIHSQSVLLAETAVLLALRRPLKGNTASWLRHTTAYRNAARSLTLATASHDLAAARAAFRQLNMTCGNCHVDHR